MYSIEVKSYLATENNYKQKHVKHSLVEDTSDQKI